MRMILALLLLTACTAPNHLGNPLALPVHGLSTAFENAAYARDRTAVKAWITKNAGAMRAEGFAGAVTDQVLATLPARNHEKVRGALKDIAGHRDFAEKATVIVMVHREARQARPLTQ